MSQCVEYTVQRMGKHIHSMVRVRFLYMMHACLFLSYCIVPEVFVIL